MSSTKKRGRGRISNLAAAALKKVEEEKLAADMTIQSDNDVSTNALTIDSVCCSSDHPLRVGCNVTVRYRDNSDRVAKLIERSQGPNDGPWQYYVHYQDFNRRMDEWIASDRVLSVSSTVPTVDHQKDNDCKLKKSNSTTSIDKIVAPALVNFHPPPPLHTLSPRHVPTYSVARSGTAVSTIAEQDHDEHEGLDEAALVEHEEITKIKNISNVQLGRYIMECWYFSPFPKEFYPDGHIACLYFCEFSFRFFCTKEELIRYQQRPELVRHPPGNEIYRDNEVSMFELDGAVEKVYCQNLCYFAKLFLDHKTLYWDVDPFLFYVLCTRDQRGFHPVGYFSKEKYSEMGYNLACILTFPCVQRKGYGRFLIAFSYELSKKEEKAGSPEKPLSDLGALGYRSYWANVLLKTLRDMYNNSSSTLASSSTGTGANPPSSTTTTQLISIMDLSRITSILVDDIAATLQMLGLLRRVSTLNATTGEGEGDNNTENANQEIIYAPIELIETLLLKFPDAVLGVDPDRLHWAPLYVTDPKKDKWSFRSKKELRAGTAGAGTINKSSSLNTSAYTNANTMDDCEGSVSNVSVQ